MTSTICWVARILYLAITYDNLGSTSKALNSWDRARSLPPGGKHVHLAINQNNLVTS